MDNPKFSIVVATYKRFPSVVKLIHSVATSNIPIENWEIIFVSSDPVESEKIKWLKERVCWNISLISCADREEGLRKKSLYIYENLGIKAAKHDWIMVINDDMWVAPDWYQQFLSYLGESRFYLPSAIIGGINLGFRIPQIGTLNIDGKEQPWWLSDFSICHKSLFEEFGYFDENINWYGKGAEWSLRMAFLTNETPVLCHDVKIGHDEPPEARVENRGDNLNAYAENDFEYVWSKWRNWAILNNKNYSFKIW